MTPKNSVTVNPNDKGSSDFLFRDDFLGQERGRYYWFEAADLCQMCAIKTRSRRMQSYMYFFFYKSVAKAVFDSVKFL